MVEAWLRSYRPEELFDENGTLIPELKAIAPEGNARITANPHANGGVLRKPLLLPDFRDYALKVAKPGQVQVSSTATLATYLADVEAGLLRIVQGFVYKFIVAYLIYRHWLVPSSYMAGIGGLLRYMYAYSFYLFFDFAGYSAFAIGTARFFGIRVPENFNAPFLSRDFREMWTRWNMTLSFWLRDHVYMRFLLLATRRRWFGGDRNRANHVALVLTFGLMGFWHGLLPHYIVYGFYQGGMMVLYDVVGRANRQRRIVPIGWRTDLIGLALTFNLFCFGLLIFSGRLFQ